MTYRYDLTMVTGEQADLLSFHVHSFGQALVLLDKKFDKPSCPATIKGRYFFAGVGLSIRRDPPPHLDPIT